MGICISQLKGKRKDENVLSDARPGGECNLLHWEMKKRRFSPGKTYRTDYRRARVKSYPLCAGQRAGGRPDLVIPQTRGSEGNLSLDGSLGHGKFLRSHSGKVAREKSQMKKSGGDLVPSLPNCPKKKREMLCAEGQLWRRGAKAFKKEVER